MKNSEGNGLNEYVLPEEEDSTRIFIMNRGLFFRQMAVIYGLKWFVCMSVTVVLGLSVWLATADLRWFIVSLMVFFIVFPMLAAFLYFSHGLRPESFFNVVPHRIRYVAEGLEAIMYRVNESGEASPNTDDMDYSSESVMKEDVKESGNPGNKTTTVECGRVLLPYKWMRGYRVGNDSVTIPCGGGLVWLPLHCFSSKRDMEKMLETISENVRKHSVNNVGLQSE